MSTGTTIKDSSIRSGGSVSFGLKIRGADESHRVIRSGICKHGKIFRLIIFWFVLCNIGTCWSTTLLLPFRCLAFFASTFCPALILCVPLFLAVWIHAENVVPVISLWIILPLSIFGSHCSCHHCSIGLIDIVLNFDRIHLFSEMPDNIGWSEFLPCLMSSGTQGRE